MSAEKKHDYHLVDPSPWPIYTSFGVASFNVSPASFGKYYSKLGCFCFEKQELKAGEKATYVMTFYLDPELVNDPTTKNLQDVTMSYTFFSTDYYKQS